MKWEMNMKIPGIWMTAGTKTPFYLRKEFTFREGIQEATAYVTGLGQFNFFLNGQKVSDHVLDPGWTDYRKIVQYVRFDVTDLLKPGRNALGMEVGNGWYIMDTEHYYTFAFPAFMPPNPNPYVPFGDSLVAAFTIEIEYRDGSREEITSGDGCRVAEHACVYSNVYSSELIDGSRRQEGFSCAGFDDAAWRTASPASPKEIPAGKFTEQFQPPVRVIRSYEGKKTGTAGNRAIYDLGQNISGLLKVKARGEKGTQIRLYPAEKLTPDGNVDQQAKNWLMIDNCITFVLGKDETEEEFAQTFTYFSGRYIGVETDGDAEILELSADAITSAWKKAGTFSCDDDRYNKIYDMIEKTVEANMLSVHTDCPTIERFAWQEPNHLMAPAIMYMKDGDLLWRKFFMDLRAAQHTAEDVFHDFAGNEIPAGDGLVPSQAPCYIPNVLPVPGMGSFYDIIPWGSTSILGVRWHYIFYGDVSVIEENYEMGCRYLSHLRTKMTNEGFICHGLGDWGNPENELARENIETAFLYADADTMAWFAQILGKEEDAAQFRTFADNVKKNYNDRLLVQDRDGRWCYRNWEKSGSVDPRKEEGNVLLEAHDAAENAQESSVYMTQACEALPLYWGMVPEDKIGDVVSAFRETLTQKGAFICGEVGLPYVIQTARKYGMNDLIARFILKEQHPSYYAFILDGETTLGEYWETNPRSHCHDMMGHIIEWYYNGIAGIEPAAPGFSKVRIHPEMPESMNRFVCRYETPHGTITVKGEREDGEAYYSFSVPETVTIIQ